MDFGLSVFWSTFILMHSFGEKILKNHFSGGGGGSFLSAIFNAVLVQVLKNTVTIGISFESFFFTIFFFEKKCIIREIWKSWKASN